MDDKGAENPCTPEAGLPSKSGKVGHCNPPIETRFKPGNPGGPGRRAAGAVIADWYNILADYELDELESVADNPRAPAAKRAAAKQWILAIRDADRGALVEVCDRTHGKAIQQIHSVSQVERVKRIATPAPTRN